MTGEAGTEVLLLRPEPGTYVLLFDLAEPVRIHPGRLGSFVLEAGTHGYVGSALGSGGVRARVGRHVRVARMGGGGHWHLDALLRIHPPREAWVGYGERRMEHRWARRLLSATGNEVGIPGFGASDCDCPGHLIRVAPARRSRVSPGRTLGSAVERVPLPRR